MSSEEGTDAHASTSQQGAAKKKRRTEQACDSCKRRKTRCEGPIESGKCINCTATSQECTYDMARKKPMRWKKEYVEDLESRVKTLESLLVQPRPSRDCSKELGLQIHPSWLTERGSSSGPGMGVSSIAETVCRMNDDMDDLGSTEENGCGLDDHNDEIALFAERLDSMHLHDRFFGESSAFRLIEQAQKAKTQPDGSPLAQFSRLPQKRCRFWAPLDFYAPQLEQSAFLFPEPLLLSALVDAYFTRLNIYLPLLHRPTFEQGIADGLHLRDNGFGALVLCVCALGSKFSSGTRNFSQDESDGDSDGWKWFNEVQILRRSLHARPGLYELQIICLCVVFLQGSSAPHVGWTLIGVGVRMAQDIGAHRRKAYSAQMTVQDELRKRAFWMLVYLDRDSSSTLGRPCAVQDEDFDTDLPAYCDDEYWDNPDNPEDNFKQPPGKPSTTAYFIASVKLNQILAFALKTIYAINKSKTLLGFVGEKWEQAIVAELDSALNTWIDNLPDHLRWDPTRENAVFFNQSASLYSSYYHLQILIHRPFIPSPHKASPLSFPSLAICANAARSCSHVLHLQQQRFPDYLLLPYSLPSAFASCIVLLLNLWDGRRSGLALNPTHEMADVYKCMHILQSAEERWHVAGRLWDVLFEMVTVGGMPTPPPSNPANNKKRGRDSGSGDAMPSSQVDLHSMGSNNVTSSSSSLAPPTIEQAPPYDSTPPIDIADPSMFALPFRTSELGSLPLYGPIDLDPPPSDVDFSNWMPSDGLLPDSTTSSYMDQHLFGTTSGDILSTSMNALDEASTGNLEHGSASGLFAHGSSQQPTQPGLDGTDITDVWSNAPTSFE
ncbi:hypothetical protein PLICRDRAFT_174295 [Plicaturopsis crispa FD-325 SS-3]|nr:hypothetical protein PLICRDRAFT_174295 [Plicaturopsis crispa FD-325 SS-3]